MLIDAASRQREMGDDVEYVSVAVNMDLTCGLRLGSYPFSQSRNATDQSPGVHGNQDEEVAQRACASITLGRAEEVEWTVVIQ